MVILDKILNRNAAKNPQEQLQRRLKQLPSLSQTELENIVAGDEAAAIRSEAIMRLDFGAALTQWAFNTSPSNTSPSNRSPSNKSDPHLSRSARQRIVDLFENQHINVSQLNNALSLEQRQHMAGLITDDKLVEQLLAELSDQQQLMELAKNHHSARLRQWAAEKITDVDAQQELLRASKGKDKSVYKLMKAQLEERAQQEKQALAVKEKVVDLIDGLERHSRTAVDHLYQAKRDHMQQQWRQVEAYASVDEKNKVSDLLKQCDALLAEAQIKPEEHTEPVPVEAKSVVDIDHINQQRNELLAGMKNALLSLLEQPGTSDRSHSELNSSHIDKRWQELDKQAGVNQALNQQYQNLQKNIIRELNNIDRLGSLEQHFESLTQKVDSEDCSQIEQEKLTARFQQRLQTGLDIAKSSLILQDVNEKFQQWQQRRKTQQEQQENLFRQIAGLIRKSQRALQDGKTGQAQGIRSTLEEKCARSQEKGKLPRHLEKQLQELDEQLGKVKDWKQYAVGPKKYSLLEQMEALVGVDEPPEALATKIKRLQDEWKTLSKGGFNDDSDLWEKFRTAGDKAYEPCKEYFAQQADIRHDNLRKRENLVSQLCEYNEQQDWEHADWKQVGKLVQMAFSEWHAYQPVERAANKAVQLKFDEVIGIIRDKLNQEYQRNKEKKKALIEEATKLADAEDNRAAIDVVKQLQSRWKAIGSASHKSDQSLWRQFRKHCDQVFDKRKQLNAEFKAELNDNKSSVQALCEEIDKISQQDLSGLLASRERVEEIRAQYREIGSLPKEKANELQKRFREAVEKYERKIAQEQTKAKAGAWDSLLQAYQIACDYCLAVVAGDDGGDLKLQVEQLIEQGEHWPKGGANALREMLAKTNATTLASDATQRRLLCIRAEILAGLESPPEDNSLRMDYQVKQLAKGFGQAQQQFQSGKEVMQMLLLEWVGMLPAMSEDYAALLARLDKCRHKIGV